jgi:pimeloyl-ACP methyl ester carboxylesterase
MTSSRPAFSDPGSVIARAAAILLTVVACAGPPTVSQRPSAPPPSTAPSPTAPPATAAAAATPAAPDMRGKFDVGGHSLYLECFGTTGPVIVFEAGSGSTTESWKRSPKDFIGRIDHGFRRCLYDRANVGQSDEVAGTRTSATAAAELHTLLGVAGLDGPYVLVGRSFGGYNVRLFAAAHPTDVRGLILIETLTPEFHDGMKALLPPAQWALEVAGVQLTEPPMDIIGSTPLVAAAKLPDVPLLVVAGTKWHAGNEPWPVVWPGAELDALWDAAQEHLAESVPNGTLVVFEGGDHSLQISQPERLADTINAFLADL